MLNAASFVVLATQSQTTEKIECLVLSLWWQFELLAYTEVNFKLNPTKRFEFSCWISILYFYYRLILYKKKFAIL